MVITLDREQFLNLMRSRRLSLSALAKEAGISRQSLYNMLKGAPVYNQPFLKLIRYLNVDPEQITSVESPVTGILKTAPHQIQKTCLALQNFAKKHKASLCLFGSRAKGDSPKGHKGAGVDWDFGLYFHQKDDEASLRRLKRVLVEQSFPYRVDVVDLNQAPSWFLEGIRQDCLIIHGDLSNLWRKAA